MMCNLCCLLTGSSPVNFDRPSSDRARQVSRQQARRPEPCRETAWGPQANCDSHWLTWNTGELEPPGQQTRSHRPYPSPEPASNSYGQKGFKSPQLINYTKPKSATHQGRPASVVARRADSAHTVEIRNVSIYIISYNTVSATQNMIIQHTAG